MMIALNSLRVSAKTISMRGKNKGKLSKRASKQSRMNRNQVNHLSSRCISKLRMGKITKVYNNNNNNKQSDRLSTPSSSNNLRFISKDSLAEART